MKLTLYPLLCTQDFGTRWRSFSIVLSLSHALDSGRLQGIDRSLPSVFGTLWVGVC